MAAKKKAAPKKVRKHLITNVNTGETRQITQTEWKDEHESLELAGWKRQEEVSEVPPTGSNEEMPQDPEKPPIGQVEIEPAE